MQCTTTVNQTAIPNLTLTTGDPARLVDTTDDELRQPATITLIPTYHLAFVRRIGRDKEPLLSKPVIRSECPHEVTVLFAK
jgi:hypothetical protein